MEKLLFLIEFWEANKAEILTALSGIFGGLMVLAALTPTERDDNALRRLQNVLAKWAGRSLPALAVFTSAALLVGCAGVTAKLNDTTGLTQVERCLIYRSTLTNLRETQAQDPQTWREGLIEGWQMTIAGNCEPRPDG